MPIFVNKKTLSIFIILLFFILLMISFAFPDLFAMFYVPHMLKEGNIYSLVIRKKPQCAWLDATWPPLYYLTIGSYLFILQFFGLLKETIFTVNQCPVWNLLIDKTFLFWAKFPFLVLHFYSAMVFSNFFNEKKFMWFLLWLLNPIAIFVNFIEGQFEIIPTFFLLLALYFAKQKKSLSCALALGFGGAYKHVPFLLLPLFVLSMGKNFRERLTFIFVSCIPYIFSLLFLFNKDFLHTLQFSENYKMFGIGIYVMGHKISVYTALYFTILFLFFKNTKKDFDTLVTYCLLLSMIYFLVTPGWFVQRILFLIPSLLLVSSIRKSIFKSLPYFYMNYFLYALIIFPGLFDITLLRPIFPYISSFPIEKFFMYPALKFLSNAFFTVFFLWVFYMLTKKTEYESVNVEKGIQYSIVSLSCYFIILVFFLSSSI